MSLVAGIDSSTQSCTVEIRNQISGELIGRGQASHPATHPPISEQNPIAWWDALVLAFDEACKQKIVNKNLITALAVDSQCHGLVTLDVNCNPVRPAKLWNDTSSAKQSEELVANKSSAFWIDSVGSNLGPSFTITKIAWLKENEPENFEKTKKFLLPHDYLTFRLTGNFVTDRAGASCTGYYSPQKSKWNFDLLSLVDKDRNWTNQLPVVKNPNEIGGVITSEAAKVLGLSDSVIVGPGTGDQFASSLGLGISEGDVVFGLGTSGVIFTVTNKHITDKLGWFNGMADASGRFMPIAVTLNATKITDWAARILNCDLHELDKLALDSEVKSNNMTLVSYFDGERTPNYPYARGVLAGIDNDQSRENFARMSYEGVLLGLIKAFKHLTNLGITTNKRIIVTGGGARGSAYPQILSDLLGREVITLDVEESSARGACVLAAAIATKTPVADVAYKWSPKEKSIFKPKQKVDLALLLQKYEKLSNFREMDRVSN